MPYDALSQLRQLSEDRQFDARTREGLAAAAKMGQQSDTMKSNVSGMYNAYTNHGRDTSEKALSAFIKASEKMGRAMRGVDDSVKGAIRSMNGMDRPIDRMARSMESLSSAGNIRLKVDTSGANAAIQSMMRRVEAMRSAFSFNIGGMVPGRVQSFANGGSVSYHRGNQNAAHRGGIFSEGRRSGDREMIFVNGGEGIITAKAISRGARNAGMSPSRYVNALNHPGTNLAGIKRGRSFAGGGKVGLPGFADAVRDFKPGAGNSPSLVVAHENLKEMLDTFAAAPKELRELMKKDFKPYMAKKTDFVLNKEENLKIYTKILKESYERHLKTILRDFNTRSGATVAGKGTQVKGASGGSIPIGDVGNTVLKTGDLENIFKDVTKLGAASPSKKRDDFLREIEKEMSNVADRIKGNENTVEGKADQARLESMKNIKSVIENTKNDSGAYRFFEGALKELDVDYDSLLKKMADESIKAAEEVTAISKRVVTPDIKRDYDKRKKELLRNKERDIETDISYVPNSLLLDSYGKVTGLNTGFNGRTEILNNLEEIDTTGNESLKKVVEDMFGNIKKSGSSFGMNKSVAFGVDKVLETSMAEFQKITEQLKDGLDMISYTNSGGGTITMSREEMLEKIGDINAVSKNTREIAQLDKRSEISILNQMKSGPDKNVGAKFMGMKDSIIEYIDSIKAHAITGDEQKKAESFEKVWKSILSNKDSAGMAMKMFNGPLMQGEDSRKVMEEFIKAKKGGLEKFNIGTKEFNVDDIEEMFENFTGQMGPLTNEIDKLSNTFNNLPEKAKTAFDKLFGKLPVLSNYIKEQGVTWVKWGAVVGLAVDTLKQLTKVIMNFMPEMAKLNMSFMQTQQTINTFAGTNVNFDGLRKDLHMTRDQAIELGESFKTIGSEGVHSIGTVSAIAANLKSALGKVDTKALQEAVSIISDLPRDQVQVMFTGKGVLDSKANLIANLMNSNNLDKTIDVMMKGAFGQKEGGIELDPGDKAIIDAQERANQVLEDIKMGIYRFLPKGIAASTVYYGKMVGGIAALGSMTGMLFNIMAMVKVIAGDRFKGAFKDMNFSGIKEVLAKLPGKIGTGIKNVGRVVAKAAGPVLGAAAAAAMVVQLAKFIGDKITDHYAKRDAREYEANRGKNMRIYGTSFDPRKVGQASAGEKWSNITSRAVTVGIAAGSIAALATAFLPGINLGVAAIVGSIAALGGVIVGGLAGWWEKHNSVNAMGNPFAHKRERGWGEKTAMGVGYGVATIPTFIYKWLTANQADANAGSRKEFFMENIRRLEKNAAMGMGVSKEDKSNLGGDLFLKELIEIKKQVKGIKMIMDGKFSAFYQNMLRGNQSLIGMFGSIGGTNANYDTVRTAVFSNLRMAYDTDMRLISQRRSNAMSEGATMGIEGRANILLEIIKAEETMHKKYLEQMSAVINQMGKAPDIMKSKMEQEMNVGFYTQMSNGFIGGSSLQVNGMTSDFGNGMKDIGQLSKEYSENAKEMTATFERINETLQKTTAEMERIANETGFKDEKEAYRRIEEIKRNNPDQLKDLDTLMDDINDFTNKAHDLNTKTNGNVKEDDLKELNQQIENIMSRLGNEVEQLEKKDANGQLTSDEKKLLTELRDTYKKMKSESKTGNARDRLSAYMKFSAASIDYNGMAATKLDENTKADWNNAVRMITIAMAKNNVSDSQVAAMEKMKENSQKYLQEIQSVSTRFIQSIDKVLNNGAVMFYDKISKALNTSIDFDMYGNGEAIWESLDADVRKLNEQWNAADKATTAVNDMNLGEMQQEVNKMLDAEKEALTNDDIIEQYIDNIDSNTKKIADELADNAIANAEMERDKGIGSEIRKALEGKSGSKKADLDAKSLGFKNIKEALSKNDQELGEAYKKALKGPDAEEIRKAEAEIENLKEQIYEGARGSTQSRLREAEEKLNKLKLFKIDKDFLNEKARENINGYQEKASEKISVQIEEKEKARQNYEKSQANKEKRAAEIKEERTYMADKSQEVADLMKEQAEAAKEVLSSGGHNKEAMDRYAKATEDLNAAIEQIKSSGLDDKKKSELQQRIMSIGSVYTPIVQAADKVLDAQVNAKRDFMAVYTKILGVLEKSLMNGENMYREAVYARRSSEQRFQNEFGDAREAVGMRGSTVAAARASREGQMAMINEGVRKQNEELNKLMAKKRKDAEELAIKTPGMKVDYKALDNMEKAGREKIAQSMYDSMFKLNQDYLNRINEAYQSSFEMIGRWKESLSVQEDLFSSLGAPFEYILDVQQQMVSAKKEEFEMENQRLKDLEVYGKNSKAYKDQELKVAKAQADYLKSAFGAQRSALDQLVGQMMGAFDKVGGIFGPDGAIMEARKLGQGYTMNKQTGMNFFSGGEYITSHANRAFSMATMGNFSSHGGSMSPMQGLRGFANGGYVDEMKYLASNQSKARFGGIFNGNMKGDRNVVLANGGEGIITANAISRGARNAGMSPADYVYALNHPGQRMAKGGLVGDESDPTLEERKMMDTPEMRDAIESERKRLFEKLVEKDNNGASIQMYVQARKKAKDRIIQKRDEERKQMAARGKYLRNVAANDERMWKSGKITEDEYNSRAKDNQAQLEAFKKKKKEMEKRFSSEAGLEMDVMDETNKVYAEERLGKAGMEDLEKEARKRATERLEKRGKATRQPKPKKSDEYKDNIELLKNGLARTDNEIKSLEDEKKELATTADKDAEKAKRLEEVNSKLKDLTDYREKLAKTYENEQKLYEDAVGKENPVQKKREEAGGEEYAGGPPPEMMMSTPASIIAGMEEELAGEPVVPPPEAMEHTPGHAGGGEEPGIETPVSKEEVVPPPEVMEHTPGHAGGEGEPAPEEQAGGEEVVPPPEAMESTPARSGGEEEEVNNEEVPGAETKQAEEIDMAGAVEEAAQAGDDDILKYVKLIYEELSGEGLSKKMSKGIELADELAVKNEGNEQGPTAKEEGEQDYAGGPPEETAESTPAHSGAVDLEEEGEAGAPEPAGAPEEKKPAAGPQGDQNGENISYFKKEDGIFGYVKKIYEELTTLTGVVAGEDLIANVEAGAGKVPAGGFATLQDAYNYVAGSTGAGAVANAAATVGGGEQGRPATGSGTNAPQKPQDITIHLKLDQFDGKELVVKVLGQQGNSANLNPSAPIS